MKNGATFRLVSVTQGPKIAVSILWPFTKIGLGLIVYLCFKYCFPNIQSDQSIKMRTKIHV